VAEVVAVGPGTVVDGKEVKMEVKVGDKVIISKYAGTEVKFDGQEYTQRYQRSEQALLLALMEMVVNGVSTRKIEEITYETLRSEFSRSTISELCKNLDPMFKGGFPGHLMKRGFHLL